MSGTPNPMELTEETAQSAIHQRMDVAENRLNSITTSINDMNDDVNSIKNSLMAIQTALGIQEGQYSAQQASQDGSQEMPGVARREDEERKVTDRSTPMYGGMEPRLAHRAYSMALENAKLSTVPDFQFPTTRKMWMRLSRTIPLPETEKMALLPLAFKGTALKVFEQTIANSPDEGTDELWNLLEERICNKSQVSSLRSKYLNMKWNERKETLHEFSRRLRDTASCLPDHQTDEMMSELFRKSLPAHLRVRAHLVQGKYDEVVTRMDTVAEELKGMRSESLKAIDDGSSLQDDGTPLSGKFARNSLNRRRNKDQSQCWECGAYGHFSYNCPKKLDKGQSYRNVRTKAEGNGGNEKADAVPGKAGSYARKNQ